MRGTLGGKPAAATVAWMAGAAVQLQQEVLQPTSLTLSCVLGATVGIVLLWRLRRHASAALTIVLLCGVLGWGSTELRASRILLDRLEPALEGQDILVTGVIAELPRQGVTGTRFVFETETATLRGSVVKLPERLALGWYRSPDDEAALAGAPPELRAGQRWRLATRLRQPHGTLNPHGFDLELWSFERELGASGNVRSPASKLDEDSGRHPIERLRQSVRDAIARHVADPATAGVLAALAIGDQAAIDREGWDLFRTTGVAHLMSIKC